MVPAALRGHGRARNASSPQRNREWISRETAAKLRPGARKRRSPPISVATGRRTMNLTVNGKGIDVGEALRVHVAESLDRVLEKYFSNPIDATTTLDRKSV